MKTEAAPANATSHQIDTWSSVRAGSRVRRESRIVETAEAIHPDMIVLGSHGYSRWERLLLGSVSDSVVHHAPCSVLIVRTPAE